jgi:hypothetical protein
LRERPRRWFPLPAPFIDKGAGGRTSRA